MEFKSKRPMKVSLTFHKSSDTLISLGLFATDIPKIIIFFELFSILIRFICYPFSWCWILFGIGLDPSYIRLKSVLDAHFSKQSFSHTLSLSLSFSFFIRFLLSSAVPQISNSMLTYRFGCVYIRVQRKQLACLYYSSDNTSSLQTTL